MRIRKATEKDLRAIKKIYQEIYAERPYKEKWKPLLLKKKLKDMLTWMKTFVAVDKKKLAGFVFFYTYDWPDGKRAYIEDFGVAKEQRNTEPCVSDCQKDKREGYQTYSVLLPCI